ncbi:InlB B-repeat-containing protein, partial [Faecalicoccus pleomorphus]|uniref:InlB B-repeat-containing protein n=1 Tax=Faecalicoccus pleomorphus TaxID=1323 RepID=UPI00195F7B4E
MSNYVKRGVAVALALAMSVQLGLENPTVYAEDNASQENDLLQKSPSDDQSPADKTDETETTEETQAQSAVLTVEYATEDGEVLDTREFSGIHVGDTVLAIDIEKTIDGYTLVGVEDDDDNEYVIGQDLTLTKSEKTIRLIYQKDEAPEDNTDTNLKEEPQVSPNSVTDTDKTTYFEVRYYDENGELIPVTADGNTVQYVKGETVTAPPHQPVIKDGKKFVGWFTEPNGQGEQVDSFVINADTNFYAYYEAQTTYTITINYVFANTQEQAAKPYIAEVSNGDSFKATVDSPQLEGYTADQEQVAIDLSSVNSNQTYTVQYTGEMQTYTVKHMLQNVDGNGYTEDEEARETKSGYIGNYTQATAKTYEGFTAQGVNNTQITADTTSSNVSIEIRYNRNAYNVSYQTGNGGSYIPTQRVLYGTNINELIEDQQPTRLGYTFQGWEYNGQAVTDDTTMPAENITLTARWEANTHASYTVVYWLERVDGQGDDYVTSTTDTGRVGDEIQGPNLSSREWSAANIESAGVERDTSRDQIVTIDADGRAVKNVYYIRKTFSIYFYERSGRNWEENESLRITAKYGEDITAQWNDDNHLQHSWLVEGYQDAWINKKWYTLFANMPAENIKTYADDQQTGIHIVYKTENLDGFGYTEKARFPAGSNVNLTPEDRQPIEGFEWSRDGEESHGSGWNSHDDLVLYYTRNSYKISFENCDEISDASLKYEAQLSNAKPNDNSVKPPAGVDEDYIFGGWYTSPACEDGTEVNWDSTMPSHNMQLYAKWVAPTYTVSFDTNGAGDISPIKVEKYKSIEDQMPQAPTKEGDTFLGWYTDEDFLYEFVPSTNIVENLTLHAKWQSSTQGSYTIKYVDESGNDIAEATQGTGEIGSYITINPVEVDGYTAMSGSSSQLLAESNQTFYVQYTKDATWTFTVRYLDYETGQDILTPTKQEVAATTQQVIVQSPNMDDFSELKDYMIVSDPQITVNRDSVVGDSYTVIFYYTKKEQTYKVNHFLQMPDGEYQLVESEKLEGNIGYYVTAQPKDFEGYTCVSTEYQRSGVVTSHHEDENGLVLNVYYDRQNPITITDYEGYYDGESHGITVNGTLMNTEMIQESIQYSTDGQSWSDEPITRKNVNSSGGAYTVYVRINTKINGTTYTGETQVHSITINPRPVTIKAPSASKPYDGTPLNTWNQPAEILDNETSLGFVNDEGFITYYYTSESTITAPGEQLNQIEESTTKVDSNLKAGTILRNYDLTFQDGMLTITDRSDAEKYQVVITPNGNTTTYDGTEQSVSGIASSTFTTNTGAPLTGYTISQATFEAKGIDAGTYDVVQSGDIIIRDAGGNDVTDQFAVKVNPANLVINQRPITIAADSKTWDYDGDPHCSPISKVIENTLADGHTYTATVRANTEDGTIQEQGESAINEISNVVISDKQGNDVTKNYDIKTVNGTLRINAIDAAIVAKVNIAQKTSTYNGKMQKFTDINGQDYELSFSFANSEDAIDTTGWHLINDEITTQRLTAGESTAAFANPTAVKVVDKEGHEVTTAQLSVTQGKLTITQAEITIKADSAQREYNGEALTAPTYTQKGLQSNDAINNIAIVGSQLEPGSSDNVITAGSVRILNPDYQNYDVTNSYKITLENGKLTVTNENKADRKITITAGDAQKPYDGTPLTQNVFLVEGDFETGDSINRNAVKTIGSQTVAGESDNVIDPETVQILNGSIDVTEAYTIEYKTGKLEVSKRPITLTADSKSKVYDGTPLAAPDVKMDGTLGQGDSFKENPVALGSVTEVTGPDGVANKVAENLTIQTEDGTDRTNCYDITFVPGKLVITKAPASENAVSINSDTITYDGNSHKLEDATSMVANGTKIYYRLQGQDEKAWTTEMPSYQNVGTYTIEVKAENPNYEDAFTTGTLRIERRPVTITGNSKTFTYNGDEQKVEGYTWTQQSDNVGLVNGHEITNVEAIASATNAGNRITGTITPQNEVQILANGEDVSANYLITTVPGSITIQPKEITITSVDAEKKYNGQALIKHEVVDEPELAAGDSISYSYTGNQTIIGSSENSFTVNLSDENNQSINQNYKVNYDYGTLTVYGEISYNANGGTGETPEPDRFDAGDNYVVKDNMFTRDGYTFAGWNSRADGTGRSFGEGALITSLTNNRTLYAQWIADEDTAYTVETYLEDEDGNYPEKPSSSILRNAKTDTSVSVTEQDLMAPEGYAFDPEAGNVLEGTVAGDGSLTLKIYFGKDVIGPEEGGDQIPDRYQLLFTYVAEENGSVSGEVKELHTFVTEDGEYYEPTAMTPEA